MLLHTNFLKEGELLNEIICGDALAVMRLMPDESVHCICTSPPFFGHRDYGCDGQIGLEETPEQYIDKLTEVFREARRLLKPDGSAWINIGDTYAKSGAITNIKQKDMLCIPFLLALALRDDGWWLRSSIIWAKTNAMPESVKDRPVSSHEHIFLLAKSSRYYYDYEAVKQPIAEGTLQRMKRGKSSAHKYVSGVPGQKTQPINNPRPNRTGEEMELPSTRALRDVWTVCTNGYRSVHCAAFPVELITPCILAGCPKDGIVLDCFMGSGTTGVAALTEGRNFMGIELNPEYCAIARERIAHTTTQTEMLLLL